MSSLRVLGTTIREVLTRPSQEAGATEVNLQEDEPRVLQVLIHYFYYFELDTTGRPTTSGLSAFLVHVYALADRYDVAPLCSLVVQRLNIVCNPAQDEDDFVAVLRVTHACTSGNTLWNILLPKAKSNMSLLLKNESFRELLPEIPTIALSLLDLSERKKHAWVSE